MKRIFAALFVLLFALALATPVFAGAEPAYYVFDEAGLFDESGRAEVYETAKRVSDTLGIDVVILTTNIDHGTTASSFADAFYDEFDYGSGTTRDGLMLYIDMDNREIVSLTNGYADDWMGRSHEAIREAGTSLASDGKYAAAVNAMLEKALALGLKGNGYAGLSFGQRLAYKFTPALVLRSLAIGGVAALVVVGIMLAMHYTGSPKAPHAAMYFGEGGLRTTHAADYFIHTHTTRTAIPKDNGGSRGGGGGGGGGGRTVSSSKF